MIRILIDTSVLRNIDITRSGSIRIITRLAKSDTIQLYFPQVVVDEYKTGKASDTKKLWKASLKPLSAILKVPIPDSVRDATEKLIGEVGSQARLLRDYAGTKLQSLIEETGATILPIRDHHGQIVMTDYFEGNPPYKSKKNRPDIPDSFIWQSIADLVAEFPDACVISSDKAMIEACKSIGASHYSSFNSFLESEETALVVAGEISVKHLRDIVSEYTDWRDKIVDNGEEALALAVIYGRIVHENILDDNNEGIIDRVDGVIDFEPDLNTISYIGEGLFPLHFEAKVAVFITSFLDKRDYFTLDETRINRILVEDCDSRFYQVEEHFVIKVSGELTIDVKSDKLEEPNISEGARERLLSDMDISEVSISTLEVIDD